MSRVPWLTKKSQLLLGAALLLGLGLALPEDRGADQALPVLSEIDRDDVRRIEISRGLTEKMVLTGSMDEGWKVVSPYEG
ncbi:MAG: hypothetical protein H6740_29135, partial [Alphaproteobacteria bacterium]|nr:hypothetical protein [Alphaproteobacteria bacterium]